MSEKYFLCKDCDYESTDLVDHKCPNCNSENVETYYDPGERPRQWDEPGYLDHVNKIGG